MCAQCAFVALAAIGTYTAFQKQIRARVDKALGIEDEQASIVPDSASPDFDDYPLVQQERSVTLAIFLFALSQIRHQTAAPRVVKEPPQVSVWDDERVTWTTSTSG